MVLFNIVRHVSSVGRDKFIRLWLKLTPVLILMRAWLLEPITAKWVWPERWLDGETGSGRGLQLALDQSEFILFNT